MKGLRHPSIDAEVERITPLYDFVIVEHVVQHHDCAILVPEKYQEPEHGLRTGRVVAVGRGDKKYDVLIVECLICGGKWWAEHRHECPACGAKSSMMKAAGKDRHPMHVKTGDIVVYPRVPANDVVIDGKPYTFLHEQQHILAVLEDS